MKITNVSPSKLAKGAKRHIQGLDSDLSKLHFRGEEFSAVLPGVVLAAKLDRTIEGASTLTLTVHDEDQELLNSKLVLETFDVEVDDLWFRYSGMRRVGNQTLELIFQAREVARLRIAPGALKGKRGTYTRAEFWASQVVNEVPGRPILLWIPELHEVQPIENREEAKAAEKAANVTRGKGLGTDAGGLDPSAKLTVKGIPANSEQLANGETVLRVGTSLNAPRSALLASIMAGTQENNMTNSNVSGGCMNYWCFISQTAANFDGDYTDLAETAHSFFTDGFGSGTGAIDYANQGMSPNDIAANIERPREDLRGEYAQWQSQAEDWVDAYTGGASTPATTSEGSSGSYSFERKANETIWANGTRLFEEVNWRLFESAGVIYVITEPELITSKIRMNVSDQAPGIESISFDYIVGKKQDMIEVTCRAKEWAAPPGTVAAVHGQGPMDGRYIVSSIKSDLLQPDLPVSITLKRPQKPLPEPAPEESVGSIGLGRSGGSSEPSGGSVGAELLSWAESEIGTSEGSSKQNEYASALGFSASLPWCSIFIAYGLKVVLNQDISGLGNASYSGAWLNWSGAERVSQSQLEEGDIVVFDWGDGGITDHVAIYAGNNQVVGGNQTQSGTSGAVTRTGLSTSSIVGCVRIR